MKEDFDFSQEEYSAILERLIEALTTGNRDRECLYDMSKTPDINPKQLLFDIVNDVNSNEKYDKMSEKDLSDLKKVCDKDWLSIAMWKGNKAEEINRITYNYNGSMWRGNVFSKGKAVGDFVAFEFEAIMKKLPQVSVMIKTETLIKEKDITPKNFEKKKEMISQKVSEAKKNNRKATYENTSYQKKAMIEKEKYNRLVEAARNKNVLEYFQESGYNIEKKGGQYYITEIAGLVINAEKNQWYSHYENIGRTNNTLDCLTKVLDIDFKQAVYDLTGKDISSIKSASNNYNYSNKPLYTTRPVVKAITSTAKAEKELMMPEQSENFRQMFAYMIKTRKIPPHIIEELVKAKLLYQTSFNNGIVKKCAVIEYPKSEIGNIRQRDESVALNFLPR